tara:strand:+ start:708 stop:1121 length:414 start_codon:yes stop_codon:yes gene_type:complete
VLTCGGILLQATSVAVHQLQARQPIGKRQRDGDKRRGAPAASAATLASANGTVRRQASQATCCKCGNLLASANGTDRREARRRRRKQEQERKMSSAAAMARKARTDISKGRSGDKRRSPPAASVETHWQAPTGWTGE